MYGVVWWQKKRNTEKHRDRESLALFFFPFSVIFRQKSCFLNFLHVWCGMVAKKKKHREHSFRTTSLVCYGSKEKEKQRKLNFLFTRPINFVVLKLSVCFFFFSAIPYHTTTFRHHYKNYLQLLDF